MNKIIDIIKQSSKIAILTHISEDADALCSAEALLEGLKSLNKNVQIYVNDTPESRLRFLDLNYIVYNEDDVSDDFDLCICLDCGDLNRLGSRVKIFEDSNITVNIDHHYTNPGYADENYVEGNASSTGEIIYKLLREGDIEISDRIAMLLYTAILSDTGGFRYSNTSPYTMGVAAELLEHNFDHSEIYRKIFETERREILKFKGVVMENIHEYFDGKLCITSVDKPEYDRFNVSEKDLGDIVNIPRMLEGCEIAVSVRKGIEKTKISFRSNGKYDVSVLAEKFDGGGHKMAAGASSVTSVAETEKQIIEICREMYFNQKEY